MVLEDNDYSVVKKEYIITFENGEYSISCTELNSDGKIVDFCIVRNITSDKRKAKRLFNLICRNDVSACTLYDVIYDFIC